MANLKYKSKYLLGNVESTYGTDPVLVGGDAVLTKNLSINPYEGDRASRDLDKASFGNDEEINLKPNVTLSFEVEIASSGTLGTAPAYGPMLRACGFSETINVSTDVQYAPVSAAFESATFYFFVGTGADSQLHKVRGARGSVSWSLAPGSASPTFTFNFTGYYDTPVAAVAIAGDVSDYIAPLPVNQTNTTMTIDSYAACTEEYSCDMANDVVYRDVINCQGVHITDRSPTGSLNVEAPDLATKDFFTDLIESHNGVTTGVLQVVHGTVAGNIVQFDHPKTQLSTIALADSDGLAMYNMGARYIPNLGDDEVLITIK